MANAIDRYFAADAIKAEVDEAHKKAKQDAEDYLADLRDSIGATSVRSTMFGDEAGEYHYGTTRKKQVVEYKLDSLDEFREWLSDNAKQAMWFIESMPEQFGKAWFEESGEVPDGITRVEYTQPPMATAPKIYKGDREVVKAKLLEGGNMFLAAGQLLLGDGK